MSEYFSVGCVNPGGASEAPQARPRPDLHDLLSEAAQAAAHYYRALIEQGLPEALAVRMVGDWHAAQLAGQQQYDIERALRRVEQRSGSGTWIDAQQR